MQSEMLSRIIEPLRPYVANIVKGLKEPSQERILIAEQTARFIADHRRKAQPTALTFICTHNSRRSHLSHVWAHVAAHFFGVDVETFSGGTEATACNERTVRALRRTGLSVVATEMETNNPHYLVQYAESEAPIRLFSKVYNEKGNPTNGYAAMMCCADVDENCPVVFGAEVRIPLHYLDPKDADGTPEETTRYDERCLQISREMFQIMALARQFADE